MDLAFSLVFPGARTLAYVERDTYATAILLARMEDKSLESAPVWCGDLGQFDASPFLGLVDILAASPPCQPYSSAGKQEGNTDRRSFGDGDGPLVALLRSIAACQPSMVFLENVPAWVRGGWFREFGEQLSGLGYEIDEPIFVAASDVGASQKRERVFILAVRSGSRSWGISESERWHNFADADRNGSELAGSQCDGRIQRWAECRSEMGHTKSIEDKQRRLPERTGKSDAGIVEPGAELGSDGSRDRYGFRSSISGEYMGQSQSERRRMRFDNGNSHGSAESQSAGRQLGSPNCTGPQGRSDEVGEHGSQRPVRPAGPGIFAPGPGDPRWPGIIAESPWLAPATEPGVCFMVDGRSTILDSNRADALRCGGNGVVSICAATALMELLRRRKII